jgi:hypothetical protein
MRDLVDSRLRELRAELEKGELELSRIERQRTNLRETLLRISGAIHVLEELEAQRDGSHKGAAPETESVRPTFSSSEVGA